MTTTAAVSRPGRPGARFRAPASVADPSRGTLVAVGIPLLALAVGAAWLLRSDRSLGTSIGVALALTVVAGIAEQIVVQIGPRSWYTAATPVIVLAALLGGPALGFLAGAATQVVRPGAVWRRRLAEGGLASLQGLVAGMIGIALAGGASSRAALAMASALALNSAGRLVIMLERRMVPLFEVWRRGLMIDVAEAILVFPLLSVLLIAARDSPSLVVATMASSLGVLFLIQRSRATSAAALAMEQRNARRDQLTGAPNRRAFEEAMAAEHARVVRGAVPAGIFVVDLDRFKSVNDRFGHRVGDEVLVEIVQRLRDGLRPSDLVARWGGEEITVLAPGVRSRRQLEHFGERIRSVVADLPVATSTTAIPITVSVGGTLLDGSVTPTVALARADGAMYEAKRTRDASSIVLPPRLSLRLGAA